MKKTIEDVQVDIHNHTILSGHAYSTFNEMIKEGYDKGLKLMGITDHGPKHNTPDEINQFVNMKVLPRYYEGMHVVCGCEINIVNPNGKPELRFPADKMKYLDVRLAGIHSAFKAGDIEYNTNAYIEIIKTGNVDIIVHPDRTDVPVDYDLLMKEAKENNVLLEINNHSLSNYERDDARPNIKKILDMSIKYKHPVIVGSDAHHTSDVLNYSEAFGFMNEMDFPDDLVINFDFISFNNNILSVNRAKRYGDIIAKLEDEIVDDVWNKLDEKTKIEIKLCETSMMHFGLGMRIRNEYKLWKRELYGYHPDGISNAIIKRLQEKSIKCKTMV